MLVLSRRIGETLVIGSDVRIKVMSTVGGAVKLAIDAPRHVAVHREEIFERIAAANREAAGIDGDDAASFGAIRVRETQAEAGS